MRELVWIVLFAFSLPSASWAATCLTSNRPAQAFYVSTNGDDANPGTSAAPFRNIQTGVDCLGVEGDRLEIGGGQYAEFVKLQGKSGLPDKPIVIEAQAGVAPRPVVTILASITKLVGSNHTFSFHNGSDAAPNGEWVHATERGAHPQEYVSKEIPKPPNVAIKDWVINRGAFVAEVNGRYTQLITYSRLEDLRAANETEEVICESSTDARFPPDPRPGPMVVKPDGSPTGTCRSRSCNDCQERRLWVYMGPGLWFDQAKLYVHIRLSPTHNHVPGLPDYAGETDPNKLPLTIAGSTMNALTVVSSYNVQFKGLTFHQGNNTLFLGGNGQSSENIAFDDVIVRAGRFGARTGFVTGLRFTNSVFDGGLPTWMFRSDLKDDYCFLHNDEMPTNEVCDDKIHPVQPQNSLGKDTMETLFFDEKGTNVGLIFDHCEFVNAHDLYLAGNNVSFHHNLIRNLHDEALFLDGAPTANGSVHHNVIKQVLHAISADGANIAGPWNIYRNLIDLREPTAGIRPQNARFNRSEVWRVGQPFTSNGADGTYQVFHNTFILPFREDLEGKPLAAVTYLRAQIADQHKRTAINNIFAMINRELPPADPPIIILPQRELSGDAVTSNGNLYYRIGSGNNLFALPILGDPKGFKVFGCAPQDCSSSKLGWPADPFFVRTRETRPPGDEANGVLLQDPAFLHWSSDPNAAGDPDVADDFRLQPSSPGHNTGLSLPPDLKRLDLETVGIAAPDIGAYQISPTTGLAPKLRVGVRGLHVYPQGGPGD